MKSIIEWDEKEAEAFMKKIGVSTISGISGYYLIKISNRELKDEFKLKFNERHALLEAIKREEAKGKSII